MRVFISSSVTASSLERLILNNRKNKLLILFSSQTMGWVKAAKAFIGLATSFAINSALSKPILFGINSPNMIERKVTMITTMVVAMVSA